MVPFSDRLSIGADASTRGEGIACLPYTPYGAAGKSHSRNLPRKVPLELEMNRRWKSLDRIFRNVRMLSINKLRSVDFKKVDFYWRLLGD